MLKDMVEDRIRLQSRATGKYYEQIWGEMKELEEKITKHIFVEISKMKEMKQEGCKDL